MFNFKRFVLAIAISCSMGTISTYSTIATAAEATKTNKVVIKEVLEHLHKALGSVEGNEPKDVILAHIQEARQASKEIFVGSLGAIVDRGADAIISSRRNVKNDDMDAARESLNLAIEEYTEMGKKTL